MLRLYIEESGPLAFAATTALWIVRVKAGGIWDYKLQPGYSPYNKSWLTYTRYSENPSVRTSEWFGNYNYGFTGRFLFSLNILYAGGDGAGLIWGNGFDDAGDKAAIKMGYDESE
ncbi:polymorphic toxin type 44 domain-containing protein [Paenibacillus sp. SYP-B4298]|uniref:polymorphic toxin type 44 domain-containing protein n=1 Tax=Paenibacillus sp. SYP-B4298 TaxID=2996034 RepID=UPI0022DD5F01|nr:polymorphic toxin type 44 domain-containing protein [Paenibacillus sp. SYP-B4298]